MEDVGHGSRVAERRRAAAVDVNRSAAAALELEFRALGPWIAEVISGEMAELPGGATAREELTRLARSHVDALRAMLMSSESVEDVVGSPDTAPHAREMVHAGVGIETVLEIYQLGHQTFWGWWTTQLHERVTDPVLRADAVEHASELMFAYTHTVMTEAIHAYTDEQTTWLQSVSSRRRELVDSLIGGDRAIDVTEVSATLGYDLGLHHVGVVVWVDGDLRVGGGSEAVDAAIRECARRLGAGRPLIVRTGMAGGWGWIGLPARPDDDLTSALEPQPDVRVAVGTPAGGIDGFRVTHREAVAAQERALADGTSDRVIRFEDVEVASLFRLEDEQQVQRFLSRHLGDLAAPTDRARELRNTLRAYLDEGEYAQATADRLFLHRNTLARRLDVAAQLRGRPLTERRLELAVALELLRARDGAPPGTTPAA